MPHQTIRPDGWAAPSGYADAIAATGRTIFVAGQVGWNPATTAFETDEFASQAIQALENVVTILQAAGAEPRHLTRMVWYVTGRGEYEGARRAIGTAWRRIIGTHYPAMSLVIVAGLLEPRARVEIEATAVVPA